MIPEAHGDASESHPGSTEAEDPDSLTYDGFVPSIQPRPVTQGPPTLTTERPCHHTRDPPSASRLKRGARWSMLLAYDKPMMNWAALRFLMVAVWSAISCISNADTYPSDGRTWEQVTAKFLSAEETRESAQFDEVDSKWGQLDAWRLRNLNSSRALEFLTSYTAKTHPPPLRVKAVHALGWGRFHHAIPVLSEIASDQTEPADVRAAALDPGLTATTRGNATVLRTAFALSEDKEPSVRGAAYMVLGRQQNARAVAFLIQKLRGQGERRCTHHSR